MLVLFAIFLTLFLLCTAVVVDVGYWWANAKKAQVAADACALAAAAELPQTWTPARTDCLIEGRDYVVVNLPPQTADAGAVHEGYDGKPATEVLSPYKGDSSMVEATVRMRVRPFFGRIVGMGWIHVTRRAVAERQEGDGNWAIYSHDPVGCDAGNGLEFDGGAGISIDGRIHSNSRYHVNSGSPSSGDQFWALEGTINRATCVATLDPKPEGAAYGNGPEPRDFLPQDGVFEPWPAWYTPAQFNWPNCSGANFSARNINIKAGVIELKSPLSGGGDRNINYTGNIPTGTYCALEKLTTSDSLRGTVTLLSPQLQIGGGHLDFTPHAHNVLLFAVPNWGSGWAADTNTANDGTYPSGTPITCTDRNIELQINASTIKWAGTVFNPCGRVLLNSGAATGGNPALVGTILGYMVKINQNDFKMVGLSDFGAETALALVE